MVEKKVLHLDIDELRRRAVERFGESSASVLTPGTDEETLTLLQERQIQQIELEMQIEQLRQTREEVEAALNRCTDLYDFAPVGYLTLDRNGTIRDANLTSSALFGIERSKLLGRRFEHFVSGNARSVFADYLEKIFTSPAKESCEVTLLIAGTTELSVQLEGIATASGEECRIVLIDSTERRQAEKGLQRAKEEWERTFDSVPDLIAIFDNQHRVLRVNEAMAGRLRCPPDECIGLHCHEVVHGTSVPPELCPHSRMVKDGLEHTEELHLARLGGNFQVTTTPLHDEKGARIGSVHICHDITERKQMEDALRESEEKYRTFFEQSLDAVFLGTPDGSIIEANPAACKMFGMSRKELCQVGRAGIIDLNDNRLVPALEERKRTGRTSTEMTCIRKNGEKFPAEISSIIMPGNIPRASIIIRDITERKRAVDDLRASEEQFRAIFELSSIGKAMADPLTGRFLLVNDHFCEITGYSRDEILQKNYMDITHPDDRARHHEVVEGTMSQESPSWVLDKRYIRKNGSVVWVEVSGTMLYDLDGNLKYYIAAVSDISVRKQAEETLKKFNEELENRVTERTAELRDKDQLLQIQSRQAAMGEMIGNIAHQWRQPLNNLALIVQQLPLFYEIGELTKESLQKSVAQSMNLILHMSQTINDFRNYFRPDKEMVEFKVSEAINNTLLLIEDSFKSQKIHIDVDMKQDPAINGYPNEYAQVLLNILNNAREALIEGEIDAPWISISICTEDGRAVVTISDNAGGIPEEIMSKIFDPYFTTKGPQSGTGLGLFMSKTIIEKNMGGRLAVCNISNGAEFRIEV